MKSLGKKLSRRLSSFSLRKKKRCPSPSTSSPSASSSSDEDSYHEPESNIPPKYQQAVKNMEGRMYMALLEREIPGTYPPQHEPKHWKIDDFDLGNALGKGNFGSVHRAREVAHSTDFVCAIKTMIKPTEMLHQEEPRKAMRRSKMIITELEIHSRMIHPHICRLYNYFWDPKNVYFILEFAPVGELKVPTYGFKLNKAAIYIYQVSSALRYCHEMNVIHRDIKPQNLLLDVKGNIKLADFGISIHSPISQLRRGIAGTPRFTAPEILRREKYWSKVDNWSLGVLAYMFATGIYPFTAGSKEELDDMIMNREPKFTFRIFVETPGMTDIIRRLLQKEPRERIHLKDVMEHPWMQERLNEAGCTAFE